jgi:hypothetical protein
MLDQMREHRMNYRALDPLVFYCDREIDFENGFDRDVRVVACFGPEFPVEFYKLNGITVINKR